MALHTYKHQYTSPTEYNVIQVRAEGNRIVSDNHADYLLYKIQGNTVEEIKYIAPAEPTLQEAKASKIAALKMQAQQIILAKYPDYKQRSAALGVYGEEVKHQIADYLADKIGEVNTIEAAIKSAASISEVEGIEINITT